VLSLGGIVVSRSIRIAGDEMDQEIIQFARQRHNLLIGERMAEEAKIAAGSAFPLPEERTVELRGRDLVTGLPRSIEVSSVELREAISGSLNAIIDAIKATIEQTPPELVADLMNVGLFLAGGGSLLAGMDQRIAYETKMPVHLPEDPVTCVVRGAAKALDELDTMRKLLYTGEGDKRLR